MSHLTNPTTQETSTHSYKIFSQHWNIYQKIFKHNYMKHQEIGAILHNFLSNYFHKSFKILDLGCGDAGLSSQILSNTMVTSYQGVDLSEFALNIARTSMKIIPSENSFVQNNFINVVTELAENQTEKFDAVLSSFSLHHLSSEEKDDLISQIPHILKEQGVFILVDIVLEKQETRDNYLKRYLNYMLTEWHLITPEEISLLENHITTSDFPETQATFQILAKKHNFSRFECLHLNPLYTEQILCFYK